MTTLLDAAIAIHPRAWRERYADEVRGTLLDVADASGGRVPLAELLPLGLRGLWLRARVSVTFWAGLVIIAVQLSSALGVNGYYEIDGSLTTYLIALSLGLGYALPVIGLASGWAGARSRSARIEGAGIVGAGNRLRRLAADSWPIVIFTGIGYLVAVIAVIARQGVPWFAAFGLLVLLGQVAMVLAALAIGQLFGAVLPRVLVIFAAPAAVGVATLLLFAWSTGWNVAPGGWYQSLAYVVSMEPLARIGAIAGVLIICAVLVVALRPLWARVVPVLALVAIAAAGAQPIEATEISAVPRPQSELVCSTVEPIVCLWPEQDAAFGDSLRRELGQAYAAGMALGLPMDNEAARSAAHYGLTGVPQPEGLEYDASTIGYGTSGIGPDDALAFYAFAVVSGYWEEPTSGDGELPAVEFAVSVLLGVPRDEAWPAMVDPYSGARAYDPVGIPDDAAAREVVERWLAGELDGVRSPS